jgi:hypothetical protein
MKKYIDDEENWCFEELDEMIDEREELDMENFEDEWDEEIGGHIKEDDDWEDIDIDWEDIEEEEDEDILNRLKEDLDKEMEENSEVENEEDLEEDLEEDEICELEEINVVESVGLDLKKLLDF